MKTQNKLIYSVGTILFLSSIILVAVMFLLAGSMLDKSSRADIAGRVSSTRTTVGSWIESRKRDVSTWGSIGSVESIVSAPTNREILENAHVKLAQICDKYSVYQSINVIDKEGDVIASSVKGKDRLSRLDSDQKPFNLSERVYFQKAMNGEVFVSEVLMSKVTNTPVLCISAPVMLDNAVAGVVYAVVDMKLFSDTFINSISFGKTGYAYIMNREGTLISHPNEEFILTLNLADDYDFAKQILADRKGFVEYEWKGEKKSAAFDVIPETGWTIVGTANISEVRAPVRKLGIVGFVLSLGTLIVALVTLSFVVTKVMRGMLQELLGEMNEIANNVTNQAEQVSESSLYIADGAKRSAASIEEISSSMTQIGSQIKQNADNAERARTIASTARNSAYDGHKDMDAMLNAMNDISESSSKIANIIKVIDEIAFQTNLLALNAAVEAARAGEHGKGFAVVADEVRNLASRSASAANETTELIQKAIENVQHGTGMAQKTGESLESIVNQVNEVSELITDIAQASQEQSLGVSQVSNGLDQIDQVTQGNTTTADQSASASSELLVHARKLSETIMAY